MDKKYTREEFLSKFYNLKYNDIIFHENIVNMLKKISTNNDIPHIIFYGNNGCGKKTLINILLEFLFGKTIYDIHIRECDVSGSGGKSNKVPIPTTENHIILEPNNNNFDKYLIREVVKDYVKKKPLTMFNDSKKYKVVQINKLDNLSLVAQDGLRRTIEKYSENCRFICYCNSLSKITEPIKSRFLCIHVPSVSVNIIKEFINDICLKENIIIKKNDINKIISNDVNIVLNNIYNYSVGENLQCEEYNIKIDELIEKIKNKKINEMREIIYSLTLNNKTEYELLIDVSVKILKDVKNSNKEKEIINCLSQYEILLNKSRRMIILMETIFMKISKIINEPKI